MTHACPVCRLTADRLKSQGFSLWTDDDWAWWWVSWTFPAGLRALESPACSSVGMILTPELS